ncbi:MAG: glycosyltransferase [Anaerolineae bacterium]|nr:glycosyltransferase [Anaerolineae bacterium]
MHVVQIIDGLHYGGAQKMQVVLAQEMRRRNVKLTVISLRDETEGATTAQELRDLGARVAFFPGNRLFDPGRIWRMVRFLRQESFDIVHAHLTYANILGTLTGRLAGIPTIASLRNESIDSHRVRAGVEAWLLRHWANRVMAVGHATAKAHQARLHGQRIEPIPSAMSLFPPLPPAERNALRTELVGNANRPLLIAVGRLHPQKGYSDLLNAFANLHESHPDAFLVIAGGGQLYDELTNQIKTLKLEGDVRLLGPRNDVPQLLGASDIFVSASHWEGLPVSVLEAMAAGLPIVATKVSDVPKIVPAGTGLLVAAHAPDELARAIHTLLADPTRRQIFGAAAQAHIARHHAPAAWGDKIMAFYNDLLAGQTGVLAGVAP